MKFDIFELWHKNLTVKYRNFEKCVGHNQLDNLVSNLKMKTRQKYFQK